MHNRSEVVVKRLQQVGRTRRRRRPARGAGSAGPAVTTVSDLAEWVRGVYAAFSLTADGYV